MKSIRNSKLDNYIICAESIYGRVYLIVHSDRMPTHAEAKNIMIQNRMWMDGDKVDVGLAPILTVLFHETE